MITYPLINEIWEYNGANTVTSANLVMISAAMLYQMKNNKNLKTIIIAGIILAPVMSGYESGVFSYISLVVMTLYLKYCTILTNGRLRKVILEGLGYSLPLFIALVLRLTIGYALIKFYGLSYHGNGATYILWLSDTKWAYFCFTVGNFIRYIKRGFVYFPITIFLLAFATFVVLSLVISLRRKSWLPILMCPIVFVSLFLLTLIQGEIFNYRTAQTISLFVGFIGYLLMACCVRHAKYMKIMFVLLMFLCLRQGIYLHQVLALNNQRSENEVALIHNIGIRLYRDFDLSKTVVFSCRSYDLGEWITDQVVAESFSFRQVFFGKFPRSGIQDENVGYEKFIDTDVNSVIRWAMTAFGHQKQLGLLFSYCGYDLKVPDKMTGEELSYYNRIAAENNMKPFEIRDMGDYILVCLDKPKMKR